MKRLVLFFALVPSLVFAQEALNKAAVTSLDGRIITVTIGVGATKTIWFALPPSGVRPARPEVDTSATVNPPDRVAWNGNGNLLIRKMSGSTSDSTRILIQGIDESGNLIDNADQYLSATASTFVDADFNDTNVKEFPITGLFDNVFGFKVSFTQGDLTGGNRVYEIKLPVQ